MENVKSTKELILDKALELFAKKGYSAVSVAAIAQAVGIKAPSLYKHYKSKQDIFNAIIDEISERYKNQMNFMQMDGIQASEDVDMMMHISSDQLVLLGKQLFLYFLHDEYTSQFRKMMTIEQYRDQKLADLYHRQYISDPLFYQEEMFKLFIQSGFMIDEDPYIMAMQFYSPMYLQIMHCDTYPDKEKEALLFIEQHIQQFGRIYLRKKEA